jgi:tRNA (cytidine32/uridine32-2'-O)-methyltransferase
MKEFQQLRFVLVRTSHPGNIGAVARAMKTMLQRNLYLVNPKYFPHADASARASGADDVLANARVVKSLDEALHGCTRVYGFSARLRSVTIPVLDPRSCANEVALHPMQPVAFVFGNERNGLSNEELDRCHSLVNIATNPEFSSLNLASAVQVMAHELLMALRISKGEHGLARTKSTPPATADELARFYTHLEQMLVDVGFLDPNHPRQLMRRLRRLFNRAVPDQREIGILRGILRAAQGEKPTNDQNEH